MKLRLSVAVLAILVAGTASAQHSAQKMNIGIKGGLNIYNINNDNNIEYDAKLGFNVGLLGHIHLTRQLALQPELVYSLQGAKFQNSDTKINLGYINVPVLFQYMFDNGFRLQAGPQVGFLVNAKGKTGSVKSDLKDFYKPIDVAISAGIGYVHPPSGFGIDARYNLGLSDISESAAVKSTNRGAQLGVFYLINHAHKR